MAARMNSPRPHRLSRMQAVTGMAAAALTATGCAATMPAGVTADSPAGDKLMAPVKPGAFPMVERNGQLVCTGCNQVLNADGSHRLSTMLIENLKFLRSGDALKAPRAKAGQMTMKDLVPYALLKLGMGSHMGVFEMDKQKAQAALLDSKNFQFNNEASRHILDACCVPDGTPVSDPPY